MSSVRRDIFTGNYILISEARGKRPTNLIAAASAPHIKNEDSECPFCKGNEHITPPYMYEDAEDWSIRSFPNKYPALSQEGNDTQDLGRHEILVDTASHTQQMKDFSEEHMEKVFLALAQRYKHYYNEEAAEYVQIFKNSGVRAGATQAHSHWQILAGNFVPSLPSIILSNLRQFKNQKGGCMYCAEISREISADERIVHNGEFFAVIAPYASRFTYETQIIPKRHVSSIAELDENEIRELADIARRIFNRLDEALPQVNYNILLMDTPKTGGRGLMHWHMQILPRMGNVAGYELSTGCYINHIKPEDAARKLKF